MIRPLWVMHPSALKEGVRPDVSSGQTGKSWEPWGLGPDWGLWGLPASQGASPRHEVWTLLSHRASLLRLLLVEMGGLGSGLDELRVCAEVTSLAWGIRGGHPAKQSGAWLCVWGRRLRHRDSCLKPRGGKAWWWGG